MFDSPLVYPFICIGAIAATLIVGLSLRPIFSKSKLGITARLIVLFLAAFGVFCTIFGWSYMLFHDPNLEHFFPVFGFSVLYSIIFGLIVTSGLNKSEKRRRKW